METAGHIRIEPALNEDFKALAALDKRSVQKVGELALERYRDSRAADVAAGRKLLKKEASKR